MREPMKLEDYPKEQLLIFLHNDDLIIENLRLRLKLLTGCSGFGDGDGTDGGCVDCYYNNLPQWTRCNAFADAWNKYRKEEKNG